MSLWELITNHEHYWGIPHRFGDDGNRIVQVCYGCGKVKEVQILAPATGFIDPRQNAA